MIRIVQYKDRDWVTIVYDFMTEKGARNYILDLKNVDELKECLKVIQAFLDEQEKQVE